jgi:ELWxxDGT repeat protein
LSTDLDPRLFDINKAGIGSNPSNFAAVGDTTFFLATDRASGQELYRTDGSLKGTRLVKDINPGPASSNIHDMTGLNGLLLFFADDGKHGEELWRSDGTKEGTRLVRDINPGTGNSAPASASALNLTAVFQGKMFFAADDGTHGMELWKTDGSAAGTSLVSDLNTGPAGSNPAALTVFNGRLYFQATAGAGGSQLFASDGTAAGTGLVKVLNPAGNASPFDFTAFGGSLFFAANDGTNGTQLWKTDGTPAGTAEVTVIPGGPNVRDLTNSGGSLFFAANSGLWKSDGTTAGTSLVSPVGSPSYLTPLGGKVVFSATTPGHGPQLWVSDGTAAGTTAITDINPGPFGFEPAPTRGESESRFATLGAKLFFSAGDGSAHGRQLWVSDGTAAGTAMVTDINPVGFGTNFIRDGSSVVHYEGSNPNGVTAVNGRLFFQADDGPDGAQLWTSLGAASTTRMLTQIVNGTQASRPIEGFIPGNGFTFFQADDGIHGSEVWRTDGTTAGTYMIKDIFPGPFGSAPHYLTAFDGKLLFMAIDPGHGQELWISDGTAAGTVMLKDIRAGVYNSYARDFTELNGVMYFQANDGKNGVELWRTDGTPAGTSLLKDIDPRTFGPNKFPAGSYPSSFTVFKGKIYFQARDAQGSQLWVTDGTTDGTQRVTDVNPGSGIYPNDLKVFNGHLFFAANDGAGGSGLWESDGTTAGTFLLADTNPGISYDFPEALTVVGNRLFFTADDGVNGRQLWATDGTASGTGIVKVVNPQGDAFHNQSAFTLMANVGGVLLFTADDGVHGTELWRSDGTTAGTTPVKDINPGPGDGITFTYFLDFTVADGKLFFAANDGTHGSRLWMSDGTNKGTVAVSNLLFPDSNPTQAIANVNGSLFFQADDGIHGEELWMIPAEQLEGHDHHDGRDDHDGRMHSDGDDDRGHGDAALAAVSPSGQSPLVIPGGMTWNNPSVSSRRNQPVALPTLVGGPLGPLGILRPRVIQDLAHSRRSSFGGLAEVGLGRPA